MANLLRAAPQHVKSLTCAYKQFVFGDCTVLSYMLQYVLLYMGYAEREGQAYAVGITGPSGSRTSLVLVMHGYCTMMKSIVPL